jgi:hypothetical protein
MTEIMLVIVFLVGQTGSEQVPMTRFITGFEDMSKCTSIKADAFPLGQNTTYGLIVSTGCVATTNKNNAETVIKFKPPKCGSNFDQKRTRCAWGRTPL